MAGTKVIEFDPRNIIDLLTHYTEGKVPLGAELISIGHHSILQREIGMVLESNQWDDPDLPGREGEKAPLYINYEGKKVMTWGTRDQADMQWKEGPS